LGAVDILQDLLQVLASFFAAFGILTRKAALMVRLQHAFPTDEQLDVVIFNDFERHVDPAEEFVAPRARLAAAASIIVPHDLTQEVLDGVEDLRTGRTVLT
jgi:hypothetical protein